MTDNTPTVSGSEASEASRSALARFLDSDLLHSFLSSKVTVLAAITTLGLMLAALFAPIVAPFNPFDLAQISILDARIPPIGMEWSDPRYLLGTDDQAVTCSPASCTVCAFHWQWASCPLHSQLCSAFLWA